VTAVATCPPTSEPGPPRPPRPRRELPRWLIGALGFASILALWEVLALTVFSNGRAIPAPTAVISQWQKDGASVYWANVTTTAREATRGWFWGNLIAIVLALVFIQVPFLERSLMKLAVAAYCLPVVAIGPVLAILFKGDSPKVILAALSVFFATLISMLVGLKSADAASLDVVHAYGGGSFTQLRKVKVQSSLPSLFAGLRVAAPAAVLGAVIGEYIGGENGLGVFMVSSESHLEVARTWGIAITIAAMAGLGYALTALAEYILVPWARRSSR
jgi:ABC-type nitrate/sulfonate/bicarbonate transport system permease component